MHRKTTGRPPSSRRALLERLRSALSGPSKSVVARRRDAGRRDDLRARADATGASARAERLPCEAMPARLRLALFVTATLALLAALGVTLFARPAARTDSVAFAGAVRPDIPPQDF